MRMTWRNVLQIVFALVLTVLGVLFFLRNGAELKEVGPALMEARVGYLLLALLTLGSVIFFQAAALQTTYRSLEYEVPLKVLIPLYLKRFFLSPFIPGGYSMAQYTLSKDLESYKISTGEHTFISTAYVVASVMSYMILLAPTAILSLQFFIPGDSTVFPIVEVLAGILGTLLSLCYLFRKVIAQKVRSAIKPHVKHFHSRPLLEATFLSMIVDVSGILMLWSAIRAVGLTTPIEIVAAASILVTLVLTISPLFQGLVVVEGALVFLLTQVGTPASAAFAAVLVYRAFQLWIPVVIGGFTFAYPLWHRTKQHLASTLEGKN